MSWWSRMANAFRGDQLSREIDEEIRAHIAEAIEQGRDPAEARRAFGAALRTREECRDFRVLAWLDSLRADTVFAWRQFLKHKVTTAAAVLSLALAIGACTSAFRLIDAILLRPLPVAAPEQLYAVLRHGDNDLVEDKPFTFAEWPYPSFRLMRAAVKGAGLLGAAAAARDRHSHGDRRAGRRYSTPRHGGRVPHAAGGRAGGPRAGHAIGEVHRDSALPGAAERSDDAGDAVGDPSWYCARRRASGGDPRGAHRPRGHVEGGLTCHFGRELLMHFTATV